MKVSDAFPVPARSWCLLAQPASSVGTLAREGWGRLPLPAPRVTRLATPRGVLPAETAPMVWGLRDRP